MEKYDFVRLSQKDTWGILMRDDHPLAERSSITADEIVKYPLMIPLREKIRSEILNWLKRDEKDLKIPLYYTCLLYTSMARCAGFFRIPRDRRNRGHHCGVFCRRSRRQQNRNYADQNPAANANPADIKQRDVRCV